MTNDSIIVFICEHGAAQSIVAAAHLNKIAWRIVTFCELPVEYQDIAEIDHWDNVPPVSEGYEPARDAIVRHIRRMLGKQH